MYTYDGEKLPLVNNYNIKMIGKVPLISSEACQGHDSYGEYLVQLQNTGIATICKFNNDGTFSKINSFDLASKNEKNHSNVASFGIEKVDSNDILPVLYISQCYDGTLNDMKDVCYVERINEEGSKLIQIINFDDVNHLFGYALQWVVDKSNRLLIGYGNTIGGTKPNNKMRVIVFRLPKLSEGPYVLLKEEDALETYCLQDYDYTYPTHQIGQGLCILGRKLIMPVGFGTIEEASKIYVWDLGTKVLSNVIDLTKNTSGELEDCSIRNGKLLISTVDGTYYELENL